MRTSTASDASAATITTERSSNPEKPLNSARRPACGNVDNAKGVAHSPTGEQKQKKRTFDVLPKPANLIRYRHPEDGRLRALRRGVEVEAPIAAESPRALR